MGFEKSSSVFMCIKSTITPSNNMTSTSDSSFNVFTINRSTHIYALTNSSLTGPKKLNKMEIMDGIGNLANFSVLVKSL